MLFNSVRVEITALQLTKEEKDNKKGDNKDNNNNDKEKKDDSKDKGGDMAVKKDEKKKKKDSKEKALKSATSKHPTKTIIKVNKTSKSKAVVDKKSNLQDTPKGIKDHEAKNSKVKNNNTKSNNVKNLKDIAINNKFKKISMRRNH